MDLKEVIAGLMGSFNGSSSPSVSSNGLDANVTAATYTAGGTVGKNHNQNPLLDTLTALLGGQFTPIIRSLTLLHQLFGARLGLDPTLVLTLVGAAWAFNRLARQVYSAVAKLVTAHLMCTVHVPSSDEIYTHMMKWLAVQDFMGSSRSVLAETVSKTAWEDDDELEALQLRRIAGGGEAKYLKFSNQRANAAPRFVPAVGLHGFWHKGRYFHLRRRQETFVDNNGSQHMPIGKEESLVISCFGRSPEPIKTLLRTVKQHYYSDHVARTTIKRPAMQMARRYPGRNSWVTVAVRPVRPLSTVVLDAAQKAVILADMNEYLHPATPRWYANRGIPLRRGYLFFGPPGTGKTSLSFALAGVFGLDIFVISLLEPTLTEEDLGSLFSGLPRRCVVLLEDIDAAGLRRPDEEVENETQEPAEEDKGEKKKADAEAVNGAEDKKSEPILNGTKSDDPSCPSERNEAGAEAKRSRNPETGGKGKKGKRVNGTNTMPRGQPPIQLPPRPTGSQRFPPVTRPGFPPPLPQEERRGISLSGLLNAIDGVASQEGRVLVMTTNRPEDLDEALIRPGRVDLQVSFTNATGNQARELFERMYDSGAAAEETGIRPETEGSLRKGHTQESAGGREKVMFAAMDGEEDVIEPEELRSVAEEFGAKIPDGLLSPAEIQGFLLKRKKEPRRALRETDNWVKAMRVQKKSKARVLKVQ
ncbi:hypothetical protein SODALDRAFT_327893 [Sodiomyces alkalinus F11]|uniref:Mitochondrial chaperone BCS1 n=1 Tax=Sodiomyces alkalinus (strain CBS 110278 / VKM F-3762 / F11) TaxID=1314773 RepID=A0A3N2QAB7_SODAK|nr:hypothetical protein SODALDRAFT_327893 [Sodiomyces alkalinus F11]ROT43690.1 hypothetical protein SODALDRAFT_327893 [Sodiomyces alkalinus F11]